MFRCLLIGLFFCHFLNAVDKEEFYIFPMGQGNSQLVIYQRFEGKVGILYDLGSKSLQMHPKFGFRGDWQRPFLVSTRKMSIMDANHEEDDDVLFTAQSSPTREKIFSTIQTPGTTEKKLQEKQRGTIKSELEEFIYDQLVSLDHILIFLSHSDEDHINFLNHENIPERLPIAVILAGDWFGDIGAVDGKTNFTEPAKKVLKFLSQRLRDQSVFTHFYFPYYSPDLNADITRILQPQNLLETIESLSITDVLRTFDVLAQPIIQQCLKINPDAPTPQFLHGAFLEVFRHWLPIDPRFHDILNNVYIWSLNQPADDTNNHSMVVSCALPTLNMSVILTGDAEHSVFQRIAAENPGRGFRDVLASRLNALNPLHTILLMLPHHGAWANRSGCMLRFFTPNAFGISAGDGRQHGHPSAELIEQIRNIYNKSHLLKNFQQIFYQQYSYWDKFHFITLNANREQVVDKAEENKLLFLCPNIYGCIKWDQEGIRTNFSNSIAINGQEYSVLYAAHALEANIATLETRKANIATTSSEGSDKVMLTLLPTPAEFSYDYLAQNSTGELFVGINIVDATETKTTKPSKIYFYKLLASE